MTRSKIILLALGTVLAFGPALSPALAKETREFPSTSIRPLITTSESEVATPVFVASDRAIRGEDTDTTKEDFAPEPAPQSTLETCASPRDGQDAKDDSQRVTCAAPAPGAYQLYNDVPQLRAFRQPTSQRLAP